MATAAEIAALRLLVNEPDDSNGWSDERLEALIDAGDSTNAIASGIWTAKAATFTTLVDVSESGSSRKLSDLHKQALAMATYFGGLDGGSGTTDDGTMVVTRLRRSFS